MKKLIFLFVALFFVASTQVEAKPKKYYKHNSKALSLKRHIKPAASNKLKACFVQMNEVAGVW